MRPCDVKQPMSEDARASQQPFMKQMLCLATNKGFLSGFSLIKHSGVCHHNILQLLGTKPAAERLEVGYNAEGLQGSTCRRSHRWYFYLYFSKRLRRLSVSESAELSVLSVSVTQQEQGLFFVREIDQTGLKIPLPG